MKNFPHYQMQLVKSLPKLARDEYLIWLALSPVTLAAMGYSILRATPRFFGYALPGSCVSNGWAFNFSLAPGNCVAAGNWLITRMSTDTSAHAWSWLMYGAFGIMVAFYPSAGKFRFDGFRGFMMVGLAIAVHELMWFGTYFVLHPGLPDVIGNLEVYGSFMAMCAIGLVIFWLLGYQHELDLKVLAGGFGVMIIYYVGWASAGYPLSLDLKIGVTPLVNDLSVAFIEFGSWVVIFAAVGMAYYVKQSRDTYIMKVLTAKEKPWVAMTG